MQRQQREFVERPCYHIELNYIHEPCVAAAAKRFGPERTEEDRPDASSSARSSNSCGTIELLILHDCCSLRLNCFETLR